MTLVTFRRLERLGRLGNQLHQIVGTIGVAAKNGYTPVLPRWTYAPFFSFPDDIWADMIPDDALDAEQLHDVEHIAERHRGYLQDHALWAHCHDTILDYLQPSETATEVLQATNPWIFDIPANQRIGLHIRRGDAITAGPNLYPLQSPLYVKAALEHLGDGQLLVFTDDPNWAHANLDHLGGRVVTGNADWADLQLLAGCTRIAIANSSFSYWAAVASRAAQVCYPSHWYGPGFHDLSHTPMILPGWTAIDDPQAGNVP